MTQLSACFNQMGLRDTPFSITPDTSYFFESESHLQALSGLRYTVESGGICSLSGEVGLGKTLICRTMLESFDDSVKSAYIFNPMQDAFSLLREIYFDLTGKQFSATSIVDLYRDIYSFVVDLARDGGKTVIIIDEAHQLSPEVMQVIRLLTNLETEKKKLISVILSGQPEMVAMLKSRELRPLLQRIAVHHELKPFSMAQSARYIDHRIAKASVFGSLSMSNHAKRAAHIACKGVPRRLNQVCERAILDAYVMKKECVDLFSMYRSIKEVTVLD
ncbi:MAG: AAA family ATPase [Gammaproteobacteria bacterium]|nr:AAA family ATPase [Gammaproteobacteria bacterium]